MNKKVKLKKTTLEKLAQEADVNYEAMVIKSQLIDEIKNHCAKKKISQRQLAKDVPGLTQDRVSKIFNGQVGHMTIDKLVTILSALNYTVKVKAKPKAA